MTRMQKVAICRLLSSTMKSMKDRQLNMLYIYL